MAEMFNRHHLGIFVCLSAFQDCLFLGSVVFQPISDRFMLSKLVLEFDFADFSLYGCVCECFCVLFCSSVFIQIDQVALSSQMWRYC